MYSNENSLPSCNHDLSCFSEFLAGMLHSVKIKDSYFITDWINIEAKELCEASKKLYPKNSNWTQQELRNSFINALVDKVNTTCFGAGMMYELHIERKQSTLNEIFEIFVLRDDEVAFIKNKCDYLENFEPGLDFCNCGAEIDAHQYAVSVNFTGKPYCVNYLAGFY